MVKINRKTTARITATILIIVTTLALTATATSAQTNSTNSTNTTNATLSTELEVSLVKTTFWPDEDIELSIKKPNDTMAKILKKAENHQSYDLVKEESGESSTVQIEKTGNYKLKTELYRNGSKINETTEDIEIKEIEVSIDADRTSVIKNNELTLKANTDHQVGSVSYKWMINDGTGTRKTGNTVTHKFSNKGSHMIYAIAEDSKGNTANESIEINVKNGKRIWFEIMGSQDNLLEEATVNIEDKTKETDNQGRALFYLDTRTYLVTVEDEDYLNYKQYIDVDENEVYTINMDKDAEEGNFPTIIPINLDESTIYEDSATLQFEVYDESDVECDTYIQRENTAWKYVDTTNVTGGTEVYEVNFNSLHNTTYYWKIECVDAYENEATRKSYFTVSEDKEELVVTEPEGTDEEKTSDEENSENENENDSENETDASHNKETQEFLEKVRDARKDLKKLSEPEKRLASLLSVESKLNVAEKNTKQLEEELFKEKKELEGDSWLREKEKKLKQLESSKENTIKTVSVEDWKELNLENEPDILNNYEKDVLSHPGRINTRAYHAEVQYFSGGFEFITFIVHETDSEKLIVKIPKDAAETADEVIPDGNVKVLKEDPVIEFTADSDGTAAYYLKKHVEESTLNTISYAIPKEKEGSNGITGLMSLSGLGKDGNWQFAAIGLLFALLLGYHFDVHHKVKVKTLGKEDPTGELSKIQKEIYDIREEAEKDVKAAEKAYSDIMIRYPGLTSEEKEKIYPEIMSVFEKIVSEKFNAKTEKINNFKQRGENRNAIEAYKEVELLHSNLPENLKDKMKGKLNRANSIVRDLM